MKLVPWLRSRILGVLMSDTNWLIEIRLSLSILVRLYLRSWSWPDGTPD